MSCTTWMLKIEPLVVGQFLVGGGAIEHRDDRAQHCQGDDEENNIAASTHGPALTLSELPDASSKPDAPTDALRRRPHPEYSNASKVE